MVLRITLATAFVLTVVAANMALKRWETLPVGFGLVAPAGVYAAGLAFGLRDALHERAGRWWVLAAIAIGAAVSYLIEGPDSIPGGWVPIAVASAAAFGLGEIADLAVYEPLRARAWPAAVAASNVAGAIVDSVLFLLLAFGALDHLTGLLVGKLLMVAPAVVLVAVVRRRAVPRHRFQPAGT